MKLIWSDLHEAKILISGKLEFGMKDVEMWYDIYSDRSITYHLHYKRLIGPKGWYVITISNQILYRYQQKEKKTLGISNFNNKIPKYIFDRFHNLALKFYIKVFREKGGL